MLRNDGEKEKKSIVNDSNLPDKKTHAKILDSKFYFIHHQFPSSLISQSEFE